MDEMVVIADLGVCGGIDEYIVLSHCWGPLTDQDKKRFYTTSENYKARKLGFSYVELPKTFQDVVQVTRALQKQYLWIDALYIFAYADCTIAASSAHSWRDGFLKAQSNSLDTGVQSIPSTPTCTCDFNKDVDRGPLMKRAWVLQERVLSRQIIHFSVVHTYFECGDGVMCEQFITLKPSFGKQYFILDPNFPSRVNVAGFKRTANFIQFLFQEYSTFGLSFDTDRDVVIHSLVERMGQVLETQVRYGIFHCFLSIDFISNSKHSLMVLRSVDLGFADDGQALNVKVRQFGGICRMGKKGGKCVIVDGAKEVGSLWFDMADLIQLEDCNCVVISMPKGRKKEVSWKYHVLIIQKKVRDGEYKRVGVGKVEVQYVSSDGSTGMLW
ncbi:hypothetical protein B0T25DRAFT_597688 [Lasiosphaeria hispida]|uniref:Heterokaryon incompatibility domain-containing protein n=1 Tax=Lasiosphaeria hispida TaxID=260671 RepID=A0AAJ0HW64_9PEZI|nr:hypothetical protein B0T25DRAFT_597688 [Lasiosphaeria hispida]